ncbi:MAG: histone deacetylase [Candidatus Hadarchaeales archaeon]
MATALVYSEKYLEHSPSTGHPERPERLISIVGGLRDAGLWGPPKTRIIDPPPATLDDVLLVHTKEYVENVRKHCMSGTPLDGDTPVGKNTFELALFAAGGAISAGRAVIDGTAKNSFALVRPPGHHAFRSMGGGFCYFNNIAVMIKRMQRAGVRKIAVVDYDAHHGNGTQDIFYGDPSVLYFSLHQHPSTLYPGSGFTSEIGSGEGVGYTINIPMKPGSGDAEYSSAFREIIVPIIDQFQPDMIAVSAGFDSHSDDPLTELDLSSESYGWMTNLIMDVAGKSCGGRVVVVLEGGYNLKAVSESAKNVVLALTGVKFRVPEPSDQLEVVRELKGILARWWDV